MDITYLNTLLIAIFVGVASGAIGSFIILKRMALVGDALSHVALPGIALTLAYGVDPFWGVLSFLLVAAGVVWWLEQKTRLPAEGLVGLLFTASLAVGILTLPDTEIIESLFGEFPQVGFYGLMFIIVAASLLTLAVFMLARRFLFAIAAEELARVERQGRVYDLALLLIFSFVVALGIKLVGTLLMGALTIIPALVAKNISRSMAGFLVSSTILGGVIASVGVVIAHSTHFLPGPMVILLGIGFFLVSFLFIKK